MARILDFEREDSRREPPPPVEKASSLAGGLMAELNAEEHTFVDKYLRLADKLLSTPAKVEEENPDLAQDDKAA